MSDRQFQTESQRIAALEREVKSQEQRIASISRSQVFYGVAIVLICLFTTAALIALM